MDNTMKSFCILRVVLLLSVVVLNATEKPQFLCPQRNMTVIVDDYIRLYFDGVEINDLHTDISSVNVVELPCTTRLIAIHGRNRDNVSYGEAGILASTADEFVLTNSTWKCSNISQVGWEEIDFDDSAWMSAVDYGHNGNNSQVFIPSISTSASWIWLRKYILNEDHGDLEVYCRKKIVNDSCDSNPCLNGGTCNYLGSDSFTCTCPIYSTGVNCESPNYNEAFACGTMLAWSQYNASNGFTRLCYFWTNLEDTEGRFTECRHTITGIPLYDDYIGLLNAGGNFGCSVSQNYPEDLPATSYLSCADNYQQYVFLGNSSESDRLMVCIRYPYEGVPGRK